MIQLLMDNANLAGQKLEDPVAYFRTVWDRRGYIKASDVMRTRFNIKVRIK